MNEKLFREIYSEFGKNFIAAIFYSLVIFPFISSWWDFILFLIGALLGVGFAVLDEKYLNTFYQDNDESSEKSNDKTIERKNFLVSQSPLYVISLIPTSIFIFTSSGSFFAIGLMGGLILFLLAEMAKSLSSPTLFFPKFLAKAQVDQTKQNLQKILFSSILFFVVLHFLVLL